MVALCSASRRSPSGSSCSFEELKAGPEQRDDGGEREEEEEDAADMSSDLDVRQLADDQDADDFRNDGVGEELAADRIGIEQPDVFRLQDPEADADDDGHQAQAARRRSAAARCGPSSWPPC